MLKLVNVTKKFDDTIILNNISRKSEIIFDASRREL